MNIDCKFLSFERNVFVLMYIVCKLLSLERNLFVCFNVTKKYKKNTGTGYCLSRFTSVCFGVHVVSFWCTCCKHKYSCMLILRVK